MSKQDAFKAPLRTKKEPTTIIIYTISLPQPVLSFLLFRQGDVKKKNGMHEEEKVQAGLGWGRGDERSQGWKVGIGLHSSTPQLHPLLHWQLCTGTQVQLNVVRLSKDLKKLGK